jgi:hypothetical protein
MTRKHFRQRRNLASYEICSGGNKTASHKAVGLVGGGDFTWSLGSGFVCALLIVCQLNITSHEKTLSNIKISVSRRDAGRRVIHKRFRCS